MSSSIADEITRLSGCRDDILSAISAKGVTIPEGAVLSSCPALIGSIQTGGGGGLDVMYNTSKSGSASATASYAVTGEQIPKPVYKPSSDSLKVEYGNLNYLSAYYVRLDWTAISANWKNIDIELFCPYANGQPIYVTGIVNTGYPNQTAASWPIASSMIFEDPYATWPGRSSIPTSGLTVSGSLQKACSSFILSASSNWTDPKTQLWLGFAYDYGSLNPSEMYANITANILTGYVYPYPDRPTSEGTSFSASASAIEYFVPDVSGAYTITASGAIHSQGGRAGASIFVSYLDARDEVSSQIDSYFPKQAYTVSLLSSVTTAQSGLF